jgi:hypothetical protein
MYLGGAHEPTRPGVSSLSRKRYTQYFEQNRKGHCGKTKVKTGRGPTMEEMLCACVLWR